MPTDPQQFEIRHVTIERDLRHSNSPIGDRLVYEHNRAIRELEAAVVAAGFQFYGDDVFVELQLTYRATICACGIDVTVADAHRDGCPVAAVP